MYDVAHQLDGYNFPVFIDTQTLTQSWKPILGYILYLVFSLQNYYAGIETIEVIKWISTELFDFTHICIY